MNTVLVLVFPDMGISFGIFQATCRVLFTEYFQVQESYSLSIIEFLIA